MTTQPGLSWGSPFSSVTVLDLLSGGTSGAALCTSDGTKLFGRDDDAMLLRAVSWPGPPSTTVTALDDPNAAVKSWITCSTPTGSVQVGISGDTQSAYWTTAGTVATLLTPGTGFTACRASLEQQRSISDNGLVIVGVSTGVPNGGSQATQWNSGTPALLANPTFGGGNSLNTTAARGVSASGLAAFGTAGNFSGAAFVGTLVLALYWDAGVAHALVGYLPDSLSALNSRAERCLADGSIIYGRCNPSASGLSPDPQQACYWDNLSAVDPTSGAVGDIHFLDYLSGGNSASVTYCADDLDAGDPVAVGFGNDGSGDVWAIKWTGTDAVNLGGLPSGHTSTANACSEDGSVVVGAADDVDFITWPVYWDASNVIHKLPTVAAVDDAFQGEALGVSRNGLVIFGDGNMPAEPPPTGVSINMDNVVVTSLLTESPCTSAQFSPIFEAVGPSLGLRWSDTRGKTFGNAVPQEFSSDPLWQPQWNRTGMARDRVFELFWSAAYKTALNGAFVEVQPLKS